MTSLQDNIDAMAYDLTLHAKYGYTNLIPKQEVYKAIQELREEIEQLDNPAHGEDYKRFDGLIRKKEVLALIGEKQ